MRDLGLEQMKFADAGEYGWHSCCATEEVAPCFVMATIHKHDSSRAMVQARGTLCSDADFTPFAGEKFSPKGSSTVGDYEWAQAKMLDYLFSP
jgi:hypothetical protein